MRKVLNFKDLNSYYQGDPYDLEKFYYDRIVIKSSQSLQNFFYAYTEFGQIINIRPLDKYFKKLMIEGHKGLIHLRKIDGTIYKSVEYNHCKQHDTIYDYDTLYWLDKNQYILAHSHAADLLQGSPIDFHDFGAVDENGKKVGKK